MVKALKEISPPITAIKSRSAFRWDLGLSRASDKKIISNY